MSFHFTPLRLNTTGITDAAAPLLVDLLRRNSTLQKLAVDQTNITEMTAVAIMDALRDNVALRSLECGL